MTLHHSHCDVFGAENEKNYFILALKTNLCLFSGVAFVSPQRAVGYSSTIKADCRIKLAARK